AGDANTGAFGQSVDGGTNPTDSVSDTGNGNTGGFGQSVDCGTDPTNSVCDTGNGNTGNGDTPLGTTVGRGECTDWALDRRPDLAGAVNGNAQAWTDEARAAGRPM